jgi:hypothetical protein
MRLAVTLRPGCGRKCLFSSSVPPAALNLDFLQGAFEKIHLQRLVRKQAL